MLDECPYGHMVQEYYVARVRELSARRAQARAGVRTRAQLAALQAEVRGRLAEVCGPFPDRAPLNARVTGALERPYYRVEKVIFESRPGFLVTANLYVPRRGRPPWPVVLGTCGHDGDGKASRIYQLFCQNLARLGYLVLIYDPMSQGERLQYTPRDGRDRPRGCCHEHNMAGNQMSLLGDFFGSWRVWDGVRALDYLLSRPEADPTRVGVTGNSGGGTLTTYLTALDPRFTMAAPSCFVTTYLRNLENELPADSEQIPPGILAAGLDMADYFVAHLPRPTLLLGQGNDYFDRRGLEETYAEVRRLYAIAGAEQDIELFIGPRSHGYGRENREAMARFFNRHAGVAGRAEEPRWIGPEDPKDLSATPHGQVYRLGSARVFDFTRRLAQEAAERRRPLRGGDLVAAITRRLNLPPRPAAPHYRVLRARPLDAKWRRVWAEFAVETEPGIVALVHVLPREGQLYHFPAGRSATVYVPHLSASVEAARGLAPKADPLFAVETRGIGRLSARACNDTEFFSAYGADYFYASHGHMLAEPYFGRRVHDLLSALDLFAANGCQQVHLVGRGMGALTATFAACLHPVVRRVTLHNALLSYHELTQVPVQKWPWSFMPPGVLRDFDLPDCYCLLAMEKRLTLVSPWDAQMRVWRRRDLRAHLKAIGLAWARVRWTP